MTIHPPHKAISHHMASTPYNRKINFQNWPFPYTRPPCYHIQVVPEGIGTMRVDCKFRISCREMFYKNILSEYFGTFSRKHSCWSPILITCGMKNCNFSKIALHHIVLSWEFSKTLRTTIL